MNIFGTYTGEIIAGLTTISWSICVFPFTEAARRLGPTSVNHFRLILALILTTIIILVGFNIDFKSLFTLPTSENWIWLGISGFVGLTLGDYFGFTTYAILGTRIGSVFNTLAPGAALLLGFIMLDEHLNWVALSGIFISVVGILWLTLNKEETAALPDFGHGNVKKGVIFGVLAAFCQGAGLVLYKKGINANQNAQMIPIHAAWIRLITATVSIYFITLVRGRFHLVTRPFRENHNGGVRYAVAGTIFGPVIGVTLAGYSIANVQVGVSQTIFSLIPVLVLPMAAILYKEKITYKAGLGAVVAIIGVLILIWRDTISQFLF
ncbi:MAG: DMT family transporter [Bacteroidota bacterium]